MPYYDAMQRNGQVGPEPKLTEYITKIAVVILDNKAGNT